MAAGFRDVLAWTLRWWSGRGSVPTDPGVECTIPTNKTHGELPDNKLSAELEENRTHGEVREEDL